MNYQVSWTQTAAEDLQEIISHIHQDNPIAARQVLARIRTRVETLQQFPERGRAVPELENLSLRHSYRELIERPWRLIDRIEKQHVHILAVLDGRRVLSDLLHKRLNRNTEHP